MWLQMVIEINKLTALSKPRLEECTGLKWWNARMLGDRTGTWIEQHVGSQACTCLGKGSRLDAIWIDCTGMNRIAAEENGWSHERGCKSEAKKDAPIMFMDEQWCSRGGTSNCSFKQNSWLKKCHYTLVNRNTIVWRCLQNATLTRIKDKKQRKT